MRGKVRLLTLPLMFANRYNGITNMATLQLSRLTNLRALFLQGRFMKSSITVLLKSLGFIQTKNVEPPCAAQTVSHESTAQ